MRWHTQTLDHQDQGAFPGLGGMAGLLRTVRTPEFAGVTFHEVAAKSVLNRVPGGPMPFRWTVNPMRGCVHRCTYCFARASHRYLDFDAGADFDTQIVVKVNTGEVLRRELGRSTWTREAVALGTNTDPYQRPEGRYRLMPAVIDALAAAATPFSILTKGSLLRRDLPLLTAAATAVPVGISVSLALLDPDLHREFEPGTPTPKARLELIRAVRDAGFGCGVMVAPVLPMLTDSVEQLDQLFGELAAAGATWVTVLPLNLRPGTKEWFLQRLAAHRPHLLAHYQQLFGAGAYLPTAYGVALQERVRLVRARHRWEAAPADQTRIRPGPEMSRVPAPEQVALF